MVDSRLAYQDVSKLVYSSQLNPIQCNENTSRVQIIHSNLGGSTRDQTNSIMHDTGKYNLTLYNQI